VQRNEILTAIYRSQDITDVMAKVQPEHIRDDLKQHVFLLMLEKEESEFFEIYNAGKLKHFIVKVICNLVHFKEDKFHRAQRRSTEHLVDMQFSEWLLGGQQETTREHESDLLIGNDLMQETLTALEKASESDQFKQHELELSVAKEIGNLYWYNRTLLEMYAELGTYRAVAKKTGIAVKSVHNAVAIAKEQIKTALQCHLS
jgi:DNA-directed RNA polymerase specialized sigma24 family protein